MTESFPSVTLPIRTDDGLQLNAKEAKELGSLLRDDFWNASPYPHIVVDNILPEALIQKVLADFPAERNASDVMFNIGYGGEHKRQILPEDCSAFSRELFHFFNSKPILDFLEGLTGIEGLLPDPHFAGGGYHETSRGGKLGVHADFRINETLHVQRRLNLLIYLNPEWQDDWMGQLELWTRDMKTCVAKVSPILNRCVVFSTEADTWHGHPDPLRCPPDRARQSLALYYYTVEDKPVARSTEYRARPGDGPKAILIYLDKELVRAYYWIKRRVGLSDERSSRLLGGFARKRSGG